MRRVAVIQARTGSTRLPGKVLRPLGAQPVLAWVISAALDSAACDDVVVATTDDPADAAVARLAAELGVTVVRGPVDDVLTRYLLAVDRTGADAVIRLTADCPLLDPTVIALCVRAFDPTVVDYVTTDHDHDDAMAHGFDVEVVSSEVLRRIDAVATGAHRAHVTSYVLAHPDEFRIVTVNVGPPSADLRVTLDEPADAELLDRIVGELGSGARSMGTVVSLLRDRPDLVAVNARVRQKAVAEG